MNSDLLIKMQHFFMANKRMKKDMIDIYPPDTYQMSNHYELVKYADKLYDTMQYFYSELKDFANDFLPNPVLLKKLDLLQKSMARELALCQNSIEGLKQFYVKFISDMDMKFLTEIKNECIGYYIFSYPTNSIKDAFSINELLHLFHSYIINNERLYQALEPVANKTADNNESVTLYGTFSLLGQNIYNLISDVDVGPTDIVSISDNQIIMMIRDLGHALTVEVNKIENGYRFEYFIPKICNVEKFNMLLGVNKVNSTEVGSTGVFETDNLMEFKKFLTMVPTDADIVMKRNY